MPEQPPRRILEKSRTVRRKYQRSNKRFQFTASQIQRIEREEERERRAQQLREREKKKLANKKKKAEKEAREREERRRLGLPDPNAPKITASQPLMLNFFGKKKDKDDNGNDSTRQCTGDIVDVPQEDPKEDNTAQLEDYDTATEFEDDWSDIGSILAEHHSQCSNDTSNRAASLSSDSKTAAPCDHKTTSSRKEASPSNSATNKLCESFEDDTADLLNELDPATILQTLENTEHAVLGCQTQGGGPNSHHTSSPDRIAQHGQAQELTDLKNGEVDDNKENRHPDIPHDDCGAQQLPQSVTHRYQSSQSRPSKCSGPRQALDKLLSHNSFEKASEDAVPSGNYQRVSNKQQKGLSRPENELYFEVHVDTEDEFGDFELSTQELKDLDDMIYNS